MIQRPEQKRDVAGPVDGLVLEGAVDEERFPAGDGRGREGREGREEEIHQHGSLSS